MRRSLVLWILAMVAGGTVRGDSTSGPYLIWNGSFESASRDAAVKRCPLTVLFYDLSCLKLQDRYDNLLAYDPAVGKAGEGWPFAMVDRGAEKEVARRFGVRGPWELRILGPDGALIQSLRGKPRPADVAAALRRLRSERPEVAPPGSIDWLYSYDEGVKTARRLKRAILLYFWSDDQKGTHPGENPTLRSPTMIQLCGKLVCVSLNRPVNAAIFEKYQVTEVPTLLLARPEKEIECRRIERKFDTPDVAIEAVKGTLQEVGEETVETGER